MYFTYLLYIVTMPELDVQQKLASSLSLQALRERVVGTGKEVEGREKVLKRARWER